MPGGKGKGKGKGKEANSSANQGKGQADAKGRSKGKGRGKGKGKGKAHSGYHWVPKPFRKKSLFATQSFEDAESLSGVQNARLAELRTDSEMFGVLECIIIEPPFKRLAPKEFVNTGVVIIFHGMPPSKDIAKEWGAVAESAGWTDLGCTVILPNVQMCAALQLRDFEAIVDASIELAGFHKCLLVGKAWGAQCAVELAAQGTISGKVEGLVLVAPSSPASQLCSDVTVPTFLLWATDDAVTAFEESTAWDEALDGRSAPTTFVKCASGGHNVDSMLEDERAARKLKTFSAAALLVGELEEAAESEEDTTPISVVSARGARLSDELPSFLVDVKAAHTPDAPGRDRVMSDKAKKSTRRLSLEILNWMHAGLNSAAE